MYIFKKLVTASVAGASFNKITVEMTRTIIIFIIPLMFKGSCFSSEGYVACCDVEHSWVLKAVTWSNIQAWRI